MLRSLFVNPLVSNVPRRLRSLQSPVVGVSASAPPLHHHQPQPRSCPLTYSSFSSAAAEASVKDANNAFPKVAIVGTGPAGCYTAKYLQAALDKQGLTDHAIDLIERQATIGGLVRYGVAPDHPEVKHAIHDFESALMPGCTDATGGTDPTGGTFDENSEARRHRRVRLFGNVTLGKDVQLDELRSMYDVVVLAYGCESSRHAGLPGEGELEGILSAREFVAWYNGHPDFRHIGEQVARALGVSLDGAGGADDIRPASVVVIGHGNVALDCARVLAKGGKALEDTDASRDAVAVLGGGASHVHVVGRRGHIQAAFTIKEVRELVRLEREGHGAKLRLLEAELDLGATEASLAELALPGTGRPRQRIDALLREAVAVQQPQLQQEEGNLPSTPHPPKQVHLRFLLNPVRFEADVSDPSRLGRVVCERTRLEGEPGRQRAVGTGEFESLPAQLALVSIGYKGEGVPGLQNGLFDESRGVVVHRHGRVDGPSTSDDDGGGRRRWGGLYASGWLKRGPSGIIGTNIPDAKETVAAIVADLAALRDARGGSSGASASNAPTLDSVLQSRKVPVVDWAGYRRILDREASDRRNERQPRTKLTDPNLLLEVALGMAASPTSGETGGRSKK